MGDIEALVIKTIFFGSDGRPWGVGDQGNHQSHSLTSSLQTNFHSSIGAHGPDPHHLIAFEFIAHPKTIEKSELLRTCRRR